MNLKKRLEALIEGATPGLSLQAYHKGKKCIDIKVGQTAQYYDLASLTKIIFTVPALVKAVENKKVKIEEPIKKYLPWFAFDKLKVINCLTHTTGYPQWVPFYKKIYQKEESLKKEELQRLLRTCVLNKDAEDKSVYSDINMWVLGELLERVYEKPLLEIWNEIAKDWGIKEIFFHDHNKLKYSRSQYAPTENCKWRKRILRGEVHDENAWAMGGVAPHAGLFGSVQSVSYWGLELKKRIKTQSVMKRFVKRAVEPRVGDWALGFMLPSRGWGRFSSCGHSFSKRSFGHTGFVGTSIWYDPDCDLLVTLLSHRVHPTRENTKFRLVRPQIHDLIYQSVGSQ